MNIKRFFRNISVGFMACTTIACSVGGMSSEEVRRITADAYIMCYPLVMNYATMYRQAIDSLSPEYVGGFGKFGHYGFATPDDRIIVTPNNDTPYSWAWVDLRSEPWVLIMPEADDDITPPRYYTSQWDDLWGFVLDSPGSVMDGNAGGVYLLTTTEWSGNIPSGIKRVIRGESHFLGSLTRTGTDSTHELGPIREIQEGYRLIPLHEYTGEAAPVPADTIKWIPFVSGEERTTEFFKYVNFLLQYVIPNESDKPVLEEMAKLGIAAGKSWDASRLSKRYEKAMAAGIADAWERLEAYKPNAVSSALFNTRENLKTDYLARMLGVNVGIFGNYAEQAVYFAINKDSDGNPINTADGNYKLTFAAGQEPKAAYFWSFTMYGLPDRFLVDNPINRYSIGSLSPQLIRNSDGTLDIYFSKSSPGITKENNWLPGPDGPCWIVLRVYGPSPEAIDGRWTLPQVVKTNL